jgi:LemA protein
MKRVVLRLIVPLFLLFLILLSVKVEYDRAITLDENVKNAWAQLQNQLKRRYDLIPNLVGAVRGYAAHEKEIFEALGEARTRYFGAKDTREKIDASREIESQLSRLLMLVERYPELKANEAFLRLQDALEGTENRISVERKRYNDAVRELNRFARSFFGRFFARLAGVGMAPYYDIPEAEKSRPEVKF